jgi:hypothetical protein
MSVSHTQHGFRVPDLKMTDTLPPARLRATNRLACSCTARCCQERTRGSSEKVGRGWKKAKGVALATKAAGFHFHPLD